MEDVKNDTDTTKHILGDWIAYRSMYGYPKRRRRILAVAPGSPTSDGTNIGVLKEEKLIGDDGQPIGNIYYERGGLRKRGQPRFFGSLKAACVTFGLTMLVEPDDSQSINTLRTPALQAGEPTRTVAKLIKKAPVRMLKKGEHKYGLKAIAEKLNVGTRTAAAWLKNAKVKKPRGSMSYGFDTAEDMMLAVSLVKSHQYMLQSKSKKKKPTKEQPKSRVYKPLAA